MCIQKVQSVKCNMKWVVKCNFSKLTKKFVVWRKGKRLMLGGQLYYRVMLYIQIILQIFFQCADVKWLMSDFNKPKIHVSLKENKFHIKVFKKKI